MLSPNTHVCVHSTEHFQSGDDLSSTKDRSTHISSIDNHLRPPPYIGRERNCRSITFVLWVNRSFALFPPINGTPMTTSPMTPVTQPPHWNRNYHSTHLRTRRFSARNPPIFVAEIGRWHCSCSRVSFWSSMSAMFFHFVPPFPPRPGGHYTIRHRVCVWI